MTIKKLLKYAQEDNIATLLDDDELSVIGTDVVENAGKDDASRQKWVDRSKEAMECALQVVEGEKSFPFPNAANIKNPQLTVAALQFHARAYPAIVQGSEIVSGKITGQDQEGQKQAQADRMAQFMNWHLLEEQEGWDEDFDKLLLALPIEGCEFKKTYFDPLKGHNVSEWVRPENLIVNNKTKNLDTCPRVTHRLFFYPNVIIEKQRSGIWRDEDLEIDIDDTKNDIQQEFYEQHCLLDLDDDGYKEPYYVTVHKESMTVVRIKARFKVEDITIKNNKVVKIKPTRHFTKYSFIPSPDGGFYDVGFGQLIRPYSKASDTLINQMLDGGTYSNTQGGFVAEGVSVNGKTGPITFKMGEFKRVKVPGGRSIRDAILPFDFPGPSVAAFNLLNFLMESINNITSIQDIMVGRQESPNEPMGTTLARMEQGMQVFVSIYKRIYRALKKELRKMHDLNAVYLEDEKYFNVLDTQDQQTIRRNDFAMDNGVAVQLVGDPTVLTNMQKIAKAQALMQMEGNPRINSAEVTKRYLDALQIPDLDQVIIPEEQIQSGPNPVMIELEAKVNKMAAETMKIEATAAKTIVEIDKTKAEIGEIVAKVSEMFNRFDMDKFKLIMESIGNEQGRVSAMEEPQGNTGNIPNIEGQNQQLPQGDIGLT